MVMIQREIASILRCDLSLIISTYEMDLLKSVFVDEKNTLTLLTAFFCWIRLIKSNKWKSFEEKAFYIY
jgi:hypothetical protein